MSFRSTDLLTTPTTRLGSSLYNLGMDSTQNTASNNPTIIVMGQLSRTVFVNSYQATYVPSRDHSIAMVLRYYGTTTLQKQCSQLEAYGKPFTYRLYGRGTHIKR
jgi:hypothetical protein